MIFNFKDLEFTNIPQKSITMDNLIEFINDNETKRIDFNSTHANVLKKYHKKWKLTLPFKDSIEPIIKKVIGDEGALFDSQYGGVWRVIDNDELSRYKRFIEKYKNIVFLRDNLDLSLALSMNYKDNARTEIGELEYQAKYNGDKNAESKLIDICKEWLNELPFYKNADVICAMPNSNTTDDSLPRRIVSSLRNFSFADISEKVSWISKEKSVKDAQDTNEKLVILKESGLTVSDKVDLDKKMLYC